MTVVFVINTYWLLQSTHLTINKIIQKLEQTLKTSVSGTNTSPLSDVYAIHWYTSFINDVG